MLARNHWVDLVRYARHEFASLEDHGEDLVADALAEIVCQRFDRYRLPSKKALRFAKRVVRFMGLRLTHELRRFQLEPLDETLPDPSWRDESEHVHVADLKRRIVAALDKLPASEREIIPRLLDEWRAGEIAKAEGVRDDAVRQRLVRVRRRFRKLFDMRTL